MRKHLIKYIISIGIILTFSGCSTFSDGVPNADINTSVNEDVNISENEEVNATVGVERIDFNKKYASYIELIDVYMNNFKNLYINVITLEESISVITGKMDIGSTEGNNATKYVDSKGNVIRYNLVIYGETGKMIIDYYVLDDIKLYVVELYETYSSPILGIGGSDILSYDMKKYIVDGNDVYYLDDVAKNIIDTNQEEANVYMTLDALNSSFIKTDN